MAADSILRGVARPLVIASDHERRVKKIDGRG